MVVAVKRFAIVFYLNFGSNLDAINSSVSMVFYLSGKYALRSLRYRIEVFSIVANVTADIVMSACATSNMVARYS